MVPKSNARGSADLPKQQGGGDLADRALSVLSGKWKVTIVWQINKASRPLRFSELKRAIPAISQRMLTRRLRELEADAVVGRKVLSLMPPRVEYSLTPRGRSLLPIIEAMFRWADESPS
jgi:DNA-binding HxlR family transcriptional regulator